MYIGIDIDVTDQVRLHNVIFQMTLEAILKKYLRDVYHMILLFMCMYQRSLINHLRQKAKLVFMLLMPTPELKTGSGIDWSDEALTQQIKEIIYRKLATIEVFEDIKSHIVSETIFT